MDLHFDSPEDAITCAKSLRVWADFMDQNADKQITGDYGGNFDGTCYHSFCALGSAALAFGNWNPYEGPIELENHGVPFEATVKVATIAARQLGIDLSHRHCAPEIPQLNDTYGVTFPQFAAACRTLAAMIEEFYCAESAPAAEHELVEA